jgi:hypothetical protein
MIQLQLSRSALGFIAGALAVLIFHQGVVAVFHLFLDGPRAPYNVTPTAPFGVPAVLSSAFFGGLWGAVMLNALWSRFEARSGWIASILFGALLPSTVAFFIVLPLKGQPVAGGWQLKIIAFALLVNGMWGLGTILIARGFRRLGLFRAIPSEGQASP